MATSLLDKAKEFARDLATLDKDIAQLKREYDLFFAGVNPKQPFDLRRKVEQLIKKHRASQIQKLELTFRYQTLVSKFNSYCDFWEKIFKRREIDPKAVSPYGPLPSQVAAQLSDNGTDEDSKAASREEAPMPAENDNQNHLRQVFNEFISAKKATGESVDNIKYENFRKLLDEKIQRIKEKSQCSDISFSVTIKGGKVSLKAKPVK